MGRLLQSAFPLVALLGGAGLVALEAAADPSPRADHPAVRHSALLAVLLWGFASALMLRKRPAGAAWLCAWLVFVVHVAAAFHMAHGWSHDAAFRHTAATAGVGEGLYVNYLFVAVWGADAVWLATWPRSHAARPRWVGWAVHGFLAFIVFNATVVFGSTAARVVGGLVFIALGSSAVLPAGRVNPFVRRAPGPLREPF
jgi:hypothetical protein